VRTGDELAGGVAERVGEGCGCDGGHFGSFELIGELAPITASVLS